MKMKINMDQPIYCCHTDTLLSFDTIIHYELLYEMFTILYSFFYLFRLAVRGWPKRPM